MNKQLQNIWESLKAIFKLFKLAIVLLGAIIFMTLPLIVATRVMNIFSAENMDWKLILALVSLLIVSAATLAMLCFSYGNNRLLPKTKRNELSRFGELFFVSTILFIFSLAVFYILLGLLKLGHNVCARDWTAISCLWIPSFVMLFFGFLPFAVAVIFLAVGLYSVFVSLNNRAMNTFGNKAKALVKKLDLFIKK